jgi:4-amino-4-deoxy-L-arabinose transferase-like glycosyltransferase
MLFGDGTVAVRLPAILLSAAFLFLTFKLSIRLYNSTGIGLLAALLCTLSPMTSVLGFLMLPDASLLFFSAMTLYLFWDFVEGKRTGWWIGGIMLGCALLSKYNGVLLCVSVVAFLALGPRDNRRLFLDWRVAGAACLALLVFSPVIVWNMQHQWTSFLFQLNHGFGSLKGVWWMLIPGPLIAQAGYVSPVVWWGSMKVLGSSFKNALETRARFIVAFGGVPIIFFFLAGIRSPGLPHWTAMGYAVLFVGLAARCSLNRTTKKIMLWGGVIFGALPLLLLSVHVAIGLIGLPYRMHFGDKEIRIRDQMDALHGWNEWSEAVRLLTLPGGRAEGVAAIVTHHWIVGGKAAYALRNTCIPVVVWRDGRTTQFDFWSTPQEYIGKDLLFVTTSQIDTSGAYWRAEAFYRADRFEQLPELSWPRANMQVTKFNMEIIRGFRGLRQFIPFTDSLFTL